MPRQNAKNEYVELLSRKIKRINKVKEEAKKVSRQLKGEARW